MKGPQYLLLVIAGLAACCWGLPAAHRWPSPRNLLPSLLVLLGIVMLMLGALLTVLPRFFLE
ncbi:MAG: hypothetical protein PHN92_14030 [Geobacter sp.]|nr:hypothetical protein [Geobacter sp.]